jgi:hypothetical protein
MWQRNCLEGNITYTVTATALFLIYEVGLLGNSRCLNFSPAFKNYRKLVYRSLDTQIVPQELEIVINNCKYITNIKDHARQLSMSKYHEREILLES